MITCYDFNLIKLYTYSTSEINRIVLLTFILFVKYLILDDTMLSKIVTSKFSDKVKERLRIAQKDQNLFGANVHIYKFVGFRVYLKLFWLNNQDLKISYSNMYFYVFSDIKMFQNMIFDKL